MKYGIFINYKRTHKQLAGRIFDFFAMKSIHPYMDEYSMHQEDYREHLLSEVQNAAYFLCLLTEDAVESLCNPNLNNEDIYFQEIATACKSKRKILVLTYGKISYEMLKKLPECISEIQYINHYAIPEQNKFFHTVMEELYSKDIDPQLLEGVTTWKERIQSNANVLIASRREIEGIYAKYEMIFGSDFMIAVRNNSATTDMNHIKEINLVCYAATAMLCNDPRQIDRMAHDGNLMFKIIMHLLEDKDFSIRMVINAPLSSATNDAIEYSKLGTNAFIENQEYVFISSYANIQNMIAIEPYRTAYNENRFMFQLTDCVLPYAMFQVIYKQGYEQFNHIKIDLYSCGIDTTKDRRSILIFENVNRDNYHFFNEQIKQFNSRHERQKSMQLIQKNGARWLEAWNEYDKRKE